LLSVVRGLRTGVALGLPCLRAIPRALARAIGPPQPPTAPRWLPFLACHSGSGFTDWLRLRQSCHPPRPPAGRAALPKPLIKIKPNAAAGQGFNSFADKELRVWGSLRSRHRGMCRPFGSPGSKGLTRTHPTGRRAFAVAGRQAPRAGFLPRRRACGSRTRDTRIMIARQRVLPLVA
jgi:hypothetical protein